MWPILTWLHGCIYLVSVQYKCLHLILTTNIKMSWMGESMITKVKLFLKNCAIFSWCKISWTPTLFLERDWFFFPLLNRFSKDSLRKWNPRRKIVDPAVRGQWGNYPINLCQVSPKWAVPKWLYYIYFLKMFHIEIGEKSPARWIMSFCQQLEYGCGYHSPYRK